MTIKDEARFRHLAGSIAIQAEQIQINDITKDTLTSLAQIQRWLSEMVSLCGQRVTYPAKKERERATEDKRRRTLNP